MVGISLYIYEKAKNGYWNEETCREEAKKYKTRAEFKNGNGSAYTAARKNGWLDSYDWFETKWGYWNEETCREEANKYKTRAEFKKGSNGAYHVALKNGWLDSYDWFVDGNKLALQARTNWNEETCREEAKKYKTRTEFAKGNASAYNVAWKHGWLDSYDWFETKWEKKWNEETCREEAKKYKTRAEFAKGNSSAYNVARKNGWLDSYDLQDPRINDTRTNYSVYRYVFKKDGEYAIYIGLTNDVNRRDKEHIFVERDAVAKYAKENGLPVPKCEVLDKELTVKQALDREEYWLLFYKKLGYHMLNRGKTGSIGGYAFGKWNEETCREEAKKYKTRTEFLKGNNSAYGVARKNGWLDSYDWFVNGNKARWDKSKHLKEHVITRVKPLSLYLKG